jgi:hypothetical protein
MPIIKRIILGLVKVTKKRGALLSALRFRVNNAFKSDLKVDR